MEDFFAPSSEGEDQQQTGYNYIDTIPNELLGLIFGELFAVDLLHCERVSRRWFWLVYELGWSRQRSLDHKIVLEGASWRQMRQFTNDCLVDLFRRTSTQLTRLNLYSFASYSPITPEICRHFYIIPNLVSLDIREIQFSDVVDYLPRNLLELHSSGPFSRRTLELLSEHCPNLISIHFYRHTNDIKVSVTALDEFIGRHRNMVKLTLEDCVNWENNDDGLISLGQLKCLDELDLQTFSSFKPNAFEAVIRGCKRLRRLKFGEIQVSEVMLCELSTLPYLLELEAVSNQNFTDSVLTLIAKRGKLKKLVVRCSTEITDTSILYLIDQCKSLVTLDVDGCKKITTKSLQALMGEVNRRQMESVGQENRSERDIFLFFGANTAINWTHAREITASNPWLKLEYNTYLYNRSFRP